MSERHLSSKTRLAVSNAETGYKCSTRFFVSFPDRGIQNTTIHTTQETNMGITERNSSKTAPAVSVEQIGTKDNLKRFSQLMKMGGGGQTGIRTLETVSRLHTFQACAFDHSATCP